MIMNTLNDVWLDTSSIKDKKSWQIICRWTRFPRHEIASQNWRCSQNWKKKNSLSISILGYENKVTQKNNNKNI